MAILALVFLQGCALVPSTITLEYEPQPNVSKLPGAAQVTVEVTGRDLRENPRVGAKRNGFLMEMASIYAAENVAETVHRAITTELIARGFKVGGNNPTVQLKADVTKFYNDHVVSSIFALSGSAESDLHLTLEAKSKTQETIYSRELKVQGIEPRILTYSARNARLALTRALQNAMVEIFNDKDFIEALLGAQP